MPPGAWPEGDALPGPPSLPDVWAARWSAAPRRPVLVDGGDPGRSLSGEELARRTAQVAATLAGHGVRPGDRVLWSASATLDAIVVLLGTLRAGAVLVPVSPSSTASELAHVVGDARPAAVVTDHGDGALPPSPVLRWTLDRLLAEAALVEPVECPALRAEDDALIVYTSGTTGRPKGAVHTHASLRAGVTAVVSAWGWEPEDRLVLALPLFHVHGLGAGLFGTLTAGASAVVFERFDEAAVLDAAADSTMFFGVPTMYHRLAATGRAAELAALRLCVSGSAPLAADLWRQLHHDGVAVLERYGMSETLLTLSNPLHGERRPGSVGVPLPGVEAAIDGVDEHGVGELLVRGPSVCRGYWERPDANAAAWADGWFATGDLASVAEDGYVTIRGRRTELIITGGHNVYPAEVEALLGRHPGVAEVAVVGLPSAEWGETVVAFVVGRDGAPDLGALAALAEAELAPYKRPREVRVVASLPRNAMGKVVRGNLIEGISPG